MEEWDFVGYELKISIIGIPYITSPQDNEMSYWIIFGLGIAYDGYIGINFSQALLGRVTHICVGYLTIIGPDKGLSPGRRQAIIWTNAGILLIRTLGTNFSEILSEIHAFSFKKMRFKMSSAKWHPFCLGLNVLMSTSSILSVAQCQWIVSNINTDSLSFETVWQ